MINGKSWGILLGCVGWMFRLLSVGYLGILVVNKVYGKMCKISTLGTVLKRKLSRLIGRLSLRWVPHANEPKARWNEHQNETFNMNPPPSCHQSSFTRW